MLLKIFLEISLFCIVVVFIFSEILYSILQQSQKK